MASRAASACSATSACTSRRCGGTSSPTRCGKSARRSRRRPRWRCTSGASLGMAPRFSTAHLATHNFAVAGVRKSFTSLPDEFLFIDENTRGILCLQMAAEALTKIVHIGVSSPVADVPFAAAKRALEEVIRSQRAAVRPTRRAALLLLACGRTTSPIAWAGRSIAARTPATSPASTRSICCSACAAQTIRTTRSCSSTRCCSCCRRTRRGCATA